MVNAYHALVSLLMSKKSNYECNGRDNMRLFMSTAYYAQQHFGSVTDSIYEAKNANQQSNQINRNANDLVQKISRQDILELLDKLNIQSANGMQSNRTKLGKIPINDLKQRLRNWVLQPMGRKQNYRNDYSTCYLEGMSS
jgi:hypothetical protein